MGAPRPMPARVARSLSVLGRRAIECDLDRLLHDVEPLAVRRLLPGLDHVEDDRPNANPRAIFGLDDDRAILDDLEWHIRTGHVAALERDRSHAHGYAQLLSGP